MKCNSNCKYYDMCGDRGEIIEDGDECEAYVPEPPTVAFLCKDKGTEYCHHTKHIEQARNFEKVGPNQWMEKEPSTTTFELYKDDDFSGGGYLLCTKCNMKFSFGAYHILEYDNFCPHCGRRVIRQADPDTVVFTFVRVKEGEEE